MEATGIQLSWPELDTVILSFGDIDSASLMLLSRWWVREKSVLCNLFRINTTVIAQKQEQTNPDRQSAAARFSPEDQSQARATAR